ncbi:MAG: NUDIX domain-containing protein [Flavobacteriales bacterium]|nr:NUDIX domain-containing protein [Flavobacteriales bacterium]
MESVQSYSVFINDKVIRLGHFDFGGQVPDFYLSELDGLNDPTMLFKTPSKEIYIDIGPYFSDKQVFKKFGIGFKCIDAAGGIVVNEKGEILCIHRLGRWDFPKGKLEKGESPIAAALREVEEECGLPTVRKGVFEATTYHMYLLHHKWVLKRTYWYELQGDSHLKLMPQKEEGIGMVKWLTSLQIQDLFLPNTYPALVDLWNRYLFFR